MAPKYKSRRAKRYEKVRVKGFLPWEARSLSNIPESVPYFKKMAEDRNREWSTFKRSKKMKGKSFDEVERAFSRRIKSRYQAKGWWRGKGLQASSVYSMFRSYEDQYAPNYPAYISPWQPKQKKFRDNVSMIEKWRKKRGK